MNIILHIYTLKLDRNKNTYEHDQSRGVSNVEGLANGLQDSTPSFWDKFFQIFDSQAKKLNSSWTSIV